MNSVKYHKILCYLIGGIFLLLPFSVAFDCGSHQLELPSEPLLIIVGSAGLYYAFLVRAWTMPFIKHPLFQVSVLYIGWAFICTVFANHFYVAAKYTSVTIAHWWIYFCLCLIIFNKTRYVYRLWLLYALSFTLILFYAWGQHTLYDFRMDAAVLVARPFYFDHALYGTTALLLLGFIVPLLSLKNPWGWAAGIMASLFLLGVYLSFSRAAWLSLSGALVLTILIAVFRFNFNQFLKLTSLFLLLVIMGLMFRLPKNKQQAISKKGNSWQHFSSILNTGTDASNLERINRYSCAWRMYKTKPFSGYGPGNFIIDYYSFQRPYEMTRLSVNEHKKHQPGRGGGTHSEYLQALSEMGLVGLLLWLLLALVSIRTAIRIAQTSANFFHRKVALAILFSLFTFYIHSFFNNFFHQEKIMALIWSALVILILMDAASAKKLE